MASTQGAQALPEVLPCGKHGLKLPRVGLGTMGMTAFYVKNPGEHEEEGLKTISRALELGCNHLDTAWVYNNKDESGVHHWNESLVGKAIAKHGRDKFIIATKFGIDFSNPAKPFRSSEADIRRQLSESLARLGTDYIDLYYQHRQDPEVPIEEVARVFNALLKEGKIRYVGFSEVTASELRRAAAICPVSAIQMEYSLQTRDIEESVIPAARELGVGIVAYSPLGRGLLGRRFTKAEDIKDGDFRAHQPRLQGENADKNFAAAERLEEIAKREGIAPATLALAWVLSRGNDIFPIPGSKAVERVEQNIAAATVKVSAEVLAEVESAVGVGAGARYAPAHAGATFNSRE